MRNKGTRDRTSLDGKVAIVTGAGSGIGRALCVALGHAGARVIVTDVDGGAAGATRELVAGATSVALDVRDREAVEHLVRDIVDDHGRLDLLFNNAGIGIGGEIDQLGPAHWDRIIDVNVRGVVHGVNAAYPVMVAQGSGHIVNTASLAGLLPLPLLTPYALTKHAIVGLSTSLRLEAETRGVRVSVVCPAAVETPLLDTRGPLDLPTPTDQVDARRYLTDLLGAAYPADRLARDVLEGVARNDAIIVAPRAAKAAWIASRLFPAVSDRLVRKGLAKERAQIGSGATSERAAQVAVSS